jgi:hypothetical protein
MVLHYAECSDVLWHGLLGQVVQRLQAEHPPLRNAILAFSKLALKVAGRGSPSDPGLKGSGGIGGTGRSAAAQRLAPRKKAT